MKELVLNEINGNEIINFLNDTDLDGRPYRFEEQEVVGDTYFLTFTAQYNNWGTNQDEEGTITIKYGTVQSMLGGGFEGGGIDDDIEEELTEWLKTHTFNKDPRGEFNEILSKAFNLLGYVRFQDKSDLEQVIKLLNKAKTYMK